MRYPTVRFAVMADPHYYSPSLGTSGPAFANMMATTTDVKLLLDSVEILDTAVNTLLDERPDFVLACGDLTKDGELVSHREFATKLRLLLAAGIPVLVTNGNHDINNTHAQSFLGAVEQPAEQVTHLDFADIYQDLGFGTAIARDAHSLSYVAEPVPGLWILVLDSCRWQGRARVGGRLRSETLRWAVDMLEQARQAERAVIGMMHHGLLEHYPGNRRFYSKYIIDNDIVVAEKLAKAGLQTVFTGHFHAQDVQRKRWPDGSYIYDIETSSLATFPCSMRIVEIDADQRMRIRPLPVKVTASQGREFRQYARRYCYDTGVTMAQRRLRKLGIPAKHAAKIAPQVIDAFEAHVTGNEQKPDRVLDLDGVSPWAKFVMRQRRPLLEGLWAQEGPPDNALDIQLTTGTWYDPK